MQVFLALLAAICAIGAFPCAFAGAVTGHTTEGIALAVGLGFLAFYFGMLADRAREVAGTPPVQDN